MFVPSAKNNSHVWMDKKVGNHKRQKHNNGIIWDGWLDSRLLKYNNGKCTIKMTEETPEK